MTSPESISYSPRIAGGNFECQWRFIPLRHDVPQIIGGVVFTLETSPRLTPVTPWSNHQTVETTGMGPCQPQPPCLIVDFQKWHFESPFPTWAICSAWGGIQKMILLPETHSNSTWKMDGWKLEVGRWSFYSFGIPSWQVRTVSFSEGIPQMNI